MIAKIMVPEKGTPETLGQVRLEVPRLDVTSSTRRRGGPPRGCSWR